MKRRVLVADGVEVTVNSLGKSMDSGTEAHTKLRQFPPSGMILIRFSKRCSAPFARRSTTSTEESRHIPTNWSPQLAAVDDCWN
jgi:hypothetical protein